MAFSGFGPYHHLWHVDTPTKGTNVFHTPCAMPPVLGLVKIDLWQEKLALLQTAFYRVFLG
jgi:hypothetical protein